MLDVKMLDAGELNSRMRLIFRYLASNILMFNAWYLVF